MRNFLLACMILLPLPALAQVKTSGEKGPVEITAQKTLEWDRGQSLYSATGGATAKQGNFSVSSDDMQAHYEGDQSNLTLIEANGNVVLNSEGRTGQGDKGVYDLKTGLATLTGQNLTLNAPDTVITAKDKFTFDTNKHVFDAYGKGKAVQAAAKREIIGDRLTATFTDKNELSTMQANGNVSLKADQDTVTGDKANYNALTKKADVTGREVVLTRGPNILKGERATVDLNTNVSTLYGGESKPATAVFYPKSAESGKPKDGASQ